MAALARWCNVKLTDTDVRVDLNHIGASLSDGTVLLTLLEVVTDTAVRSVCGRGFHTAPTSMEQRLENCDLVFEFLAAFGVPWRARGATDILMGSQVVAVDVLWTILCRLSLGDGGRSGDQGLLAWCQDLTRRKGCDVTDFGASWSSGKAFAALISCLSPSTFTYDAEDPRAPRDLLAAVFSAAAAFGIAPILEVEDVVTPDSVDERAVVAYLSLLLLYAEAQRLEAQLAALPPEEVPVAEAPPSAASTPTSATHPRQAVLLMPRPEKPLTLSVALSPSGLFLLERLRPLPSETDLLSGRLPALVPLAGLDRVVCSLFWLFASVTSPAAAPRVMTCHKFRMFGAAAKLTPAKAPLAVLPRLLSLTKMAPEAVPPPPADAPPCLPPDALEAAFLRVWRHAKRVGAPRTSTNRSGAHAALRWAIDLDRFAEVLEGVAVTLYGGDPRAAVHSLTLRHLVPALEEIGVKVRQRMEKAAATRVADIRVVHANRAQLGTLFTAYHQPHSPRVPPKSTASPPASKPKTNAKGVRTRRLSNVLGALTESAKPPSVSTASAVSPGNGGMFGSPKAGGLSPASAARRRREDALHAERARATAAILQRSTVAAGEQPAPDKVLVRSESLRSNATPLSPLRSPISALSRVRRVSTTETEEPPTLANLDRSVTHHMRPAVVSPLVPRRDVHRVAASPQGLSRRMTLHSLPTGSEAVRSTPPTRRASVGAMSPLLRTKTLLEGDAADPSTLPATSINLARRAGGHVGPHTPRTPKGFGGVTSPIPLLRSPLSRGTSLRDRHQEATDTSSVTSEESDTQGLSASVLLARRGRDLGLTRGESSGEASPVSQDLNRVAHLDLERVRRMSRGETGAPSATNFSPKSLPGVGSPVSHQSPLSRPSSVRSDRSVCDSPVHDTTSPGASPTLAARAIDSGSSVSSGVEGAALSRPAPVYAKPRAPPEPPRRAIPRSDAFAEPRNSPPLHPATRKPSRGNLLLPDDDQAPGDTLPVAALISMMRDAGVAPSVVTDANIRQLVRAATGDAAAATSPATVTFTQFEALLVVLSRFVAPSASASSPMQALLASMNRSPVFTRFLTRAGPAAKPFDV